MRGFYTAIRRPSSTNKSGDGVHPIAQHLPTVSNLAAQQRENGSDDTSAVADSESGPVPVIIMTSRPGRTEADWRQQRRQQQQQQQQKHIGDDLSTDGSSLLTTAGAHTTPVGSQIAEGSGGPCPEAHSLQESTALQTHTATHRSTVHFDLSDQSAAMQSAAEGLEQLSGSAAASQQHDSKPDAGGGFLRYLPPASDG